MTNEEKVEHLKKFQACDHIHQLTCLHCSDEPLVPEIKGEEVILFCTKCAYIQRNIPDAVFKVSDKFLTSSVADLFKSEDEI